MAEEVKKASVVVDGRTLTVRVPEADQLLAWLGLVNGLTGDLSEMEQGQVNEDLTLIMDAILGLFEDEDERRWYRRAAVLGKVTLSDILTAAVGAEAAPTTGPKPKVRRAGGR